MIHVLIIIFISVAFTVNCQKEKDLTPIISGVHWVTIHVRTQETFAHLYQLFNDDLQFPVFFHPEKYGTENYTAILAGNVILEICGPFPESPYSNKDIMARCNTCIFWPFKSSRLSAVELQKRLIKYNDMKNSSLSFLINLTIKELTTERMPVHLSDSCDVRKKQQVILDSLYTVLQKKDGGPIGFKYIEEIYIGYKNEEYLDKWNRFLEPLESKDNLWHLPKSPNLRFIKSDSEEIKAFVFKVESYEKAVNYLRNNSMLGDVGKDMVEININTTKGLRIILQE